MREGCASRSFSVVVPIVNPRGSSCRSGFSFSAMHVQRNESYVHVMT